VSIESAKPAGLFKSCFVLFVNVATDFTSVVSVVWLGRSDFLFNVLRQAHYIE
jgi:hypothetical protein